MAELFEHGALVDEIERAEWAVSEIATAMLAHAGQLEVSTAWSGGRVRVEISSDDPVDPLSAHRGGRRGLVQVLQHATETWGKDTDDARSTVWFEVAVPDSTTIDLRAASLGSGFESGDEGGPRRPGAPSSTA